MQDLQQKRKPKEGDYAPFYAAYVQEIETDDIVRFLEEQKAAALAFFKHIPWEKWEVSYAEGKWTLAQLVLHLIDSERIFAYRALCIARGDQTPLPGFDQEAYVETGEANSRTPVSLADEFATVREATVHLFRNFSPAMWERRGTAADSEITPSALAWIIAGHLQHHLRVIQERYLNA
ncbi:MAG: DinB family protein [Saprospiraceae bacterium]|nr:DinB family protein [Saprospiraceae bacterium]MDW8229762.1 DinB family protein [Saprospiraceae bacterium]